MAPASSAERARTSTVAARYELLRPLGSAEPATTWWAADHRREGSPVVVKRVGSPTVAGQELARQHELRHPNLGVATAVVYDGEAAWLLGAGYPGGDLRAWLQSAPTLAARIKALVGIARGLRYLHERGVVHTDLKLENVVLDGRGQARIVDFGLALDTSTRRTEVSGSVQTLAPEVIRGEPLSVAADRFALGVIAYELLSGRAPMEAAPDELLRRRAAGERSAPLPAIDGIPKEAAAVIDALLHPEPGRRPEPAALLKALGEGESHESVAARVQVPGTFGRPTVEAQLEALLDGLSRRSSALTRTLWVVGGPGSGRSSTAAVARTRAMVRGLSAAEDTRLGTATDFDAWFQEIQRAQGDAERGQLLVFDGLPGPGACEALARAVRAHAGRGLAPLGALLLLSPTEAASPTAQTLREALEPFAEVNDERLEALDLGATRSLLQRQSPGLPVPEAFVAALHAQTGGLPAQLQAVLAELVEREATPLQTQLPFDVAELDKLSSPQTLAERTLARLTAAGTEALVDMALLGGRLARHRRLAMGIAELAVDELLAAGAVVEGRAADGSPELCMAGEALRDRVLQTPDVEARTPRLLERLRAEPTVDRARLGRLLARVGAYAEAAALLQASDYVQEAAGLFQRAMDEGDRSPDVVRSLVRCKASLGDFVGAREVLVAWGEGLADVGLELARLELDAGQAREALETLEVAAPPGDEHERLAARALLLLGRPAEALKRLAKGLGLSDPPAPQQHLSEDALHAALTWGLSVFYMGRFEEALAVLRAWTSATEAAEGRFRELPMLLNGVAIVHQRRGELEAAARWYARSLDAARQQGNTPRVGIALMNLGTLAQEGGRLSEARARYEEATGIARRTGDVTALMKALMNETNVLLQLGALDEAEARLPLGRRLAARRGDPFHAAYFELLDADRHLRSGDPARALSGALRAHAAFTATSSANEAAESALLAARAAVDARREAAEVQERLARLEGAAATIDSARLRLWTALLRATWELDRAGGSRSRALTLLEDAHRAAPEETGTEELWRLGVAQAQALAINGRRGDARLQAREATQRLDDLVAALSEPHQRSFEALREIARARDTLSLLSGGESGGAPGSDGLLQQVLELNGRITSEPDPDRLLRTILDIAIATTGAERGFVITPSEAREDEDLGFKVRTARNFERETLKRSSSRYSATVAEEVLVTGRPLLTIDAMSDDRLRRNESIHALKLRSILCVPMRRRGVPIGVVYVDNRFQRGAFTAAQLAFMEAFADQASIALEAAEGLNRERLAREAAEEARARLEQAHADVARLNGELEAEVKRRGDALDAAQRDLEVVRAAEPRFKDLVGNSAPMRAVFAVLARLAPTDVSVLVTGESGTGKELVARALHDRGPRAGRPFVSINCAALPESLLESEFFGVVRGAYTGADRDRAGLFEQAHTGTLFLDEIGEMPLNLQAKLLRALETRTVRRVGGSRDNAVDVRVLSATNRDLQEQVRQGRFREDLLFRIRVVDVRLPALRERLEDLPALIDYLSARAEARRGVHARPIGPEAMTAMARYGWPGNVRELDSVLTQAFLLAEGPVVTRSDLRLDPAAVVAVPLREPWDGRSTLEDSIREVIRSAWEQLNRNQSKAAEALGIDRSTLRAKLGVTEGQPRGRPRRAAPKE